MGLEGEGAGRSVLNRGNAESGGKSFQLVGGQAERRLWKEDLSFLPLLKSSL
jgi:hypothetical protein